MIRNRDAYGRFAPPPDPVIEPVPVVKLATQFRVVTTVGGVVTPRGPWRDFERRAMDDAINAKLASYDEERREWYLAVPVSLQKRNV